MEIKVGTFYKLANGKKAMILEIDNGWYHAAVYSKPAKTAASHGWTFFRFTQTTDIVCEWVEKPKFDRTIVPAWHKWMAMDPDGTWFSYTDAPKFRSDGAFSANGGNYLRIPDEYAPEWEGKPEDSLIELDNQDD
jgi:hypothetical protein